MLKIHALSLYSLFSKFSQDGLKFLFLKVPHIPSIIPTGILYYRSLDKVAKVWINEARSSSAKMEQRVYANKDDRKHYLRWGFIL